MPRYSLPTTSGFSLLWSEKEEDPCLEIGAGYTVGSWPGLGRPGKAEKFNCPSHLQLRSDFNERTHARKRQLLSVPLCPLRPTAQRRGTQCSPIRLDTRTRTRVLARRRQFCRQLELFRPSGRKPTPWVRGEAGNLSAEVGGRGTRHMYSLVASQYRSRPQTLSQPLGDPLPAKSGRGGVKMAAPLRIQSDWAQALR